MHDRLRVWTTSDGSKGRTRTATRTWAGTSGPPLATAGPSNDSLLAKPCFDCGDGPADVDLPGCAAAKLLAFPMPDRRGAGVDADDATVVAIRRSPRGADRVPVV
jgi:hypothetical protein